MKLGIDQISRLFKKLSKKRLGLLCHSASVNSHYEHLLDLLKNSPQKPKLTALFGPEHGLWAVAQDMESVEGETYRGTPIHSLYGKELESLQPKAEWMENLEAVICDLQDVGARYYTFVYTIAFVMKACAQKGIPVYVLDRPNPIGGEAVEGNLIQPGYESFVGAFSIANRHGMTVGELCQLFNEEFKIHADLKVIPLKNWNRKHYLDEAPGNIKKTWVLPSPNMPTLDAAIVYPGMCLLEATEVSEARGTTKPFEIFGAPFVDPEQLKKYLEQKFKLEGVFFRPLYFKPTFQKLAHQVCGGLQLHVTNRKKFKSYLTGLAIVKALYDFYPPSLREVQRRSNPENTTGSPRFTRDDHGFQWRSKPYEFVKDIPAIDLLTGSSQFRNALETGKSWKEILSFYEDGKEKFLKQRKEYLMY